MPAAHTDKTYEQELQTLRDRLLAMVGTVEEMIAGAVRALVERNADLARNTILMDRSVNRAELAIDELCMLILAKRQPVASDLRFVTLSLKMVTDIERIGDVAVNLCERAIDLAALPPLSEYEDIPAMARIAGSMVRDAIDAFIEGDVAKAESVIARDDEVDDLYHRIFRELLAIIRENPDAVERGIHLQAVAKYLERIGDHGTNLAEQVIFVLRGKDVRHQGKLN